MSESRQSSNDSEPNVKDYAALGILDHLAGMQTDMRNHRRAEAHGDAQLRQHYGKDYDTGSMPEDVINYNSPIHNHPPQQSKWLPVLASLAGAGVTAAAVLGWELSSAGKAEPGKTVNTTKGWILEAGE